MTEPWRYQIGYWHGYCAGRWQQIRRRLNWQYLRGYLAGLLSRY